jgi:hypothetical protein
MKGIIIGSDLLQKGSDIKVIEINTNTTIYNEGAPLLEYDPFFNVLISNNISELHFIYTAGSSFFPTNASSFVFEDILKQKCEENNISYHHYIVPENSVTVPYIEDTPNKFILRQAFDTTALVDDLYCADKGEFINLMSGSNYTPNSYVNTSEINVDEITDLNNSNPNHPNYVIKARIPNYDSQQFPELYELSLQSEIDDLKQNLSSDNLIQEFIFDNQNIIDGRYSIIRGIDIIYGSNLDIVSMGGYKQSTIIPLDFSSNEFVSGTKKYNQKTRYKYITKQLFNTSKIDYHVDDETLILDYTGSLIDVDTIKLGDYVKSIDFADLSGSLISNVTNITTFGWNGTLEKTIETLNEVSSSLVGIQSASVDTIFIQVTLENGLTWDDAPSATYYIEESGSLSTRWDRVNNFYIGDKLVVKNTQTNELETLAITNLQMVHGQKTIYDLDFEDSDLFLVDIGDGMFGIMHNSCWCCYNPCGHWCCDSGCPPCIGGPPPKL